MTALVRDVGRGVGARLGLGLLDGALASLLHLALGLVVMRSVGLEEFGAFGIAFAVYVLALGASRALACEPLTVRYAEASPDAWRRAAAGAAAVALAVGAVTAAACLLAALLVSAELRWALVALAAVLPWLLLQDAWRYAFVTAGRSGLALANDGIRAAALAVAFAVAVVVATPSAPALLLAFGSASAVGAVVGIAQARVLPRRTAALRMLARDRDLGAYFVAEFAVVAGAWQAGLLAVAALAGLEAIGALRAGEILLGPLNLLFAVVPLLAVPEAARIARRDPAALRTAAAAASGALVVVALAWGGLVAVLPDDLGVAAVGPTWLEAAEVVLPLTVAYAGYAAAVGAWIGLRAHGRARQSLKARSVAAPATAAGLAAGAAIGGAAGAAVGLAAATWVVVAVWWTAFLRAPAPGAGPTREPTARTASSPG